MNTSTKYLVQIRNHSIPHDYYLNLDSNSIPVHTDYSAARRFTSFSDAKLAEAYICNLNPDADIQIISE